MKRFLISLIAVLTLSVDGWSQDALERRVLWLINTETGDEFVLGVMVNEVTCLEVAKNLNAFSRMPPDSAQSFFCRLATVRT